MRLESYPSEYAEYRQLVECAFDFWAPTATISFKRLALGKSGAVVLKVDVRSAAQLLESGHYILKLSAKSTLQTPEDEIAAHELARRWDASFTDAHIPRMSAQFENDFGQAILFELAGYSTDAYLSVAGKENPHLLRVAETVVRDLLDHWVGPEPQEGATSPGNILDKWLGYRLERSKAPRLHDFVEASLGTDLYTVLATRVVVNPLTFCALAHSTSWADIDVLPALLHGDLHGGNILVHRAAPDSHPYWIIDLAMANEGPAGFDQAFLEVATALECLPGADPAILLGALENVNTEGNSVLAPPGTSWLIDFLRRSRLAAEDWQRTRQRYRFDVVQRQFCLARVAAGLNWANKKLLSDSQRLLAVTYAAWAAREYLEQHEPTVWLAGQTKVALSPSVEDGALWNALWEAFHGFSPGAGRFVLVAEAMDTFEAVASLGQLPWSVVIDLDPLSDETGLQRQAGPLLATHRSVHAFSKHPLPVNFSRGTAWMMAAGWKLKREPPTPFATWRYDALHVVRQVIKALDNATDPENIFVLLIPGGTLDPELPMHRLGQIASAIDEATHGRARMTIVGVRDFPDLVPHGHLPLSVSEFLTGLQAIVGRSATAEAPRIPSAGGEWRSLSIEQLHALEENLEVLHSRILDQGAAADRSDSFWRGQTPTWFDFMTSSDIQRELNEPLSLELRDRLSVSRSTSEPPQTHDSAGATTALRDRLSVSRSTVVLSHTPGSGGTTAALRAAWDLHREYPTVVLRTWSSALIDRLQSLYNTTEHPILLVADASDLTEAAREDLRRDLAQRNCRVVLLYVRRVFAADSKQPLLLADPLSDTEAGQFLAVYSTLTTERRRKDELARITRQPDLIRYRSPFYYGLITFERDFYPVERYVAAHVLGMRGKARDLLQYLAIVTIYSNTGIHEASVLRLFGLSGVSRTALEELLGEGPARLVTSRNGRLRLMHQLLAEEVLSLLCGGVGERYWRFDLPKLSIDLIRDLTDVTGPEADSVVELFRQLFVDRQGSADDADDRQDFSPLIEEIDSIDRHLGHQVLLKLTERCPGEAHFWNHLGRHQIYRIREDFDRAEEYLEQAVRLSPEDFLHYHTRGLVRRARVRQAMPDRAHLSVAQVLAAVASAFAGAAQDFERTRSLSPDNVYGYITHIQMILEVASRLRTAAGVNNLAQVGAEADTWLGENISLAARLIDDARQLYGTVDQESHFLTQCITKLEQLYGNLDDVIRIWELAQTRGVVDTASRRALANAYLYRSANLWTGMQEAELRRIVNLMELNLTSFNRSDDDYRLWFEAYKLLPDFEMNEALGRLGLWANRFPSWRAYYYIYILQFVMWFSGRTSTTGDMERALERCQVLVPGRRTSSHQWFGRQTSGCPLVSTYDLGEWRRPPNFWSHPEPLRRINGVIDDFIPGPQSGTIKIDGRVKAFFVPGRDGFSPNQDENKPVAFFLGFSPVGLRAWEVEHGSVPNGERAVPVGNAPTLQTVHVPAIGASVDLKVQRLRTMRRDSVEAHIRDLLALKTQLDGNVSTSEIATQVAATFGVDNIVAELGVDINAIATSNGTYAVVESSDRLESYISRTTGGRDDVILVSSAHQRNVGCVVKLDSEKGFGFIRPDAGQDIFFGVWSVVAEDRDHLRSGDVVEFTLETNERGPIGVGIRRTALPNAPSPEELQELVRAAVIEEIESEGELRLPELTHRLYARFPGGDLASRLGQERISHFFNSIDGVVVEGRYPDLTVRLTPAGERAFGRLPTSSLRGVTQGTEVDVATRESLRLAVASAALSIVQQSSGLVKLEALSNRLDKLFPGDGKLAHRLGFQRFGEFLLQVPGLAIEGSGTEKNVRVSPS